MIKVMVIEDEQVLRTGLVLTTPWDSYNCEVIGEAWDGVEGARLISQLRPDIVITDIRMPGMDGIEMMKQLSGTVDAEYILITGYSDFQYAKAAIELGAHGFILKPIDDDEFDEVLTKTVETVRKKRKYNKLLMEQSAKAGPLLDQLQTSVERTMYNDHYLTAAIDYIGKNIERNFSLKDIADELKISESYLSKLFKSKTSSTFLEYCTHFRLKRAAELLMDPFTRVYEVAALVGYTDSRYFSTLFKRTFGMTPTEFRKFYTHQ